MPVYQTNFYGNCARCGNFRELTKFRKENLCPRCLNPDLKPVSLEELALQRGELDSYTPEPANRTSVKVVEKLDRGHGNKIKSRHFYVGNKRIS